MAIALYDDFANTLGQFSDYDTYDSGQRTQLAAQKHVDIRSFIQGDITLPYTMYDMDGKTQSVFDGMTMAALESGNLFIKGENWTVGAVGTQSDYNHFNGIKLTCGIGATSTTSLSTAVDISTFVGADYISLACPSFPVGALTLASCFIDISSDATGAFAGGQTDSLAFSTATVIDATGAVLPATSLYPSPTLYPSAGDTELRFTVSQLVNCDHSKIAAVRFRITATASCFFRCLAIRCLATTWEFAPVDQNTRYGRLAATVPPTADLAQPYAFPVASAPVTPVDWPILLFSDGALGPALVDADVGVAIRTGSNTAANSFALYLRELALDPLSMGEMDLLSMSALDALDSQPDGIVGHIDDFANTRFLKATVTWGPSASVSLLDETGTGYTLAATLAANSDYYLRTTLAGNALRVQIYPLTPVNDIVDYTTVVFDSTTLIDSAFVSRRPGRLGWYAHLADGDTYIRHLRPRNLVYSEYRSIPLRSYTPVDGARLYTDSTPNIQALVGVTPRPGTTLAPDDTKSVSGHCVKVTCDGILPIEGLVSNTIRFENLTQSLIEFDVLAPFSASLTALLRGEGRLIMLSIPPFPTNRWTHITLPLDVVGQTFIPGPYQFILLQSNTLQNIWYIDNLSIETRAVAWSGRGQAADPWRMNNPAWIPFHDMINDPYEGALLGRGNALQIRGQVISQLGSLSQVKVLPRYSELGNFAWADQAPTYGAAPVPSFTKSTVGKILSTDGTASTATNGILDYYWTFGDGSYAYGATTSHTYLTSGTYTINLTLIDQLDLKVSTTQTVTV